MSILPLKLHCHASLLGGVAFILASVAGADHASAQLFTAGDLVVSTYGSTTSDTLLDGQTTAITLMEYALPTATSATLVLSDTLPDTASGSNAGIVGEYGSSSEGTLQLSGNDEYLTIAGYSADPSYAGTGAPGNGGYEVPTDSNPNAVALAQSTDTAVPRVVALIDANGDVNTSTVLNDVYSTNNPRSVYTQDGSSLLISGQGSGLSDQGIYSVPTGTNTVTTSATPTEIYNASTTRTIQQYGGNTYVSIDQKGKSGSETAETGVFEVSSNGTLTQITSATNGLSGSSKVDYSPEGFYFANSTTLYVADTGDPKVGNVGDGGIQKWTLSLSTNKWTLDYTLTPTGFVSPTLATTAADGQTGFEAITGEVVDGNVDLYAVSYTAGDADPNGLYAIVDPLSSTTGTGDAFTELASAPGLTGSDTADDNFKGVSFAPDAQAVPEPSTWALLGVGFAGLVWQMRRKVLIA